MGHQTTAFTYPPPKKNLQISRVSDSHIDALSATAGDYKLDTAHRGRVVGHSLVDNLLQLSMEESVLDQQFMRVNDIQVGTLVEGTVLKLTEAGLIVNLAGSITALAPRLHLADVKLTHPEKKFKIGSKVKGLVMISDPTKRRVIITIKRSIVNSDLPVLTTYEDAKPGMIVHGTISGFRPFGCIISYCNNVRALAPISELSDSFVKDPAENFQLGQTIKTRILTVDPSSASLRVSFKTTPPAEKPTKEGKKDKTSIKAVVNPIDSTIVNAQDYSPGRITKAKVTNVKENQVNLDLADNVKGRVHITEAFNDFSDIKNLKHPLRRIHHGSIIDVMVLGQHDSKSHTYLPISHRGKSNAMVECSLKFNPDAMDVDAESTKKPLEFKDLKQGDKYIGFVSEVNNDSLMVNIGTNLRGRISKMHVSQDVQVLNDLTSNYIVGQALHTVVLSADEEKKRVDLANITDGEFTADVAVADINSLEQGLIVRGTVTKADASRGVVVKLADHLFGKIHLTDIADDFVKDPTSKFEPGHIVRCYVLSVDKDTKKIDLSTRKSRLEQADSASIADPEIVSLDDIKADAIVKGYVQNVADKGLFVFVGRDTVGRVKISELSDDFVKDWKAMFKAGQVVEAKILSVNKEANQLELTLKKSAIDPTIGPKKTLADFSQGEKVKGVVTSVKPIGVFIKVENSVVSGLCHISQISDTAVSDVSKIYSVGDPVKAMILNVDLTKKRISFGLKASYFDEEEDSEDEENDLEAEDDDLEAEEDDEEGEDMLVDDDEEEEDDDDEVCTSVASLRLALPSPYLPTLGPNLLKIT
jgi:rRNA biogenesis protein RRP5